MTDKLLDLKEASARLGVSTASTRRLIKAGHVRGVRILRRILISESEISRLVLNGTK